MKLIAAYLLLQIGGNASPSKEDIKSLLETVGIDAEEDRLDKLISELEGKDINDVGFLSSFQIPSRTAIACCVDGIIDFRYTISSVFHIVILPNFASSIFYSSHPDSLFSLPPLSLHSLPHSPVQCS